MAVCPAGRPDSSSSLSPAADCTALQPGVVRKQQQVSLAPPVRCHPSAKYRTPLVNKYRTAGADIYRSQDIRISQ